MESKSPIQILIDLVRHDHRGFTFQGIQYCRGCDPHNGDRGRELLSNCMYQPILENAEVELTLQHALDRVDPR